ncbi:MAG: hypothetical protein OEX04_01585 [Acidimicrobiia bacterium]|nr:hypothetical protein [Acidimicrobiia bacterium]MDH4306146.1 hypothetical protein [Acidimicrobiia bacterium]
MVLAHGSGVDDILLFVIPVTLALIALRVAERRARTRMEELDDEDRSGIDETEGQEPL